MILSGCISTTKPIIACSSLSNNSSNPRTTNKSSKIATPKPTNIKPKQPSVAEIEQAIGAGKFRDYDPASDQGETKSFFDLALSKSIGKTEGSTEQKLRETGEWINEQAESAARSSSKRILVAMFFWIAPAWFLLFSVATGAVKLPFSFPALDDLIM